METDRRLELLRVDRQMRAVRWIIVPFAIAQLTLYQAPQGETLPYDRVLMATAVTAVLVLLNLLSLASRRIHSVRALERIGRGQLAADTFIALWVVWLFSFDPASALWALLILPVLQGAIRGRVRGAIATWAACATGYLGREIWASSVFEGRAFALESFTYRMGIVLIVALATGYLARNLESRIRDQLAARRESEHRAELLHSVARASRAMSTHDPHRVLGAMIDTTVAIGFEGAEVASVDPQAGTFTPVEHRGLPEILTQAEHPSSDGIVGLALRERSTVTVDDYSQWPGGLPEARVLGFHAVAATPIWQDGEIRHVLVVGKRDHAAISDNEIECVELLAAHAGAALTTAHHFTQRRALEAQIEHDTFHDSLTGLPNRTLFRDRLQHCLERKVTAPTPTAILFIDIDGFKKVNDSLGHEAGDEVLRLITARLREHRAPGDTVARHGADEFAVLIEEPISQHTVLEDASRIVADLQEPLAVGGTLVHVSASVGVSYGYQPDGEPRDFLREADLAMYRAKELGGGRVENYLPVMSARAKQRIDLEHELHRAIQRDELTVHYQPAVAIETNQVVGLEALVRWEHPVRGLLPAAEFIPFAEETGLIIPIGQRVLKLVSQQVQAWRTTSSVPPLPVGVNLSAAEFVYPGFIDHLTETLRAHDVKPNEIIFEITESIVMRDDTTELMQELDAIGIPLAIDDFGLGYSSLSYLKRFRFSVLKIDRSFVTDVTVRETDQAIVRYTIALAGDLGIPLVAEGVETKDQLEYLRSVDCRYVQGFYVSEALPPTGIERFIGARRSHADTSTG